jgi:hypothetical protein
MARCRFGETLVSAYLNPNLTEAHLATYVDTWRTALVHEMRTNSKGELGRKEKAASERVTPAFPNLGIVSMYLEPVISANDRSGHTIRGSPGSKLDLAELVDIMWDRFEWPNRRILLRFRNCLFAGILCQAVREHCGLAPHFNPVSLDLQRLDVSISRAKRDKAGAAVYYRVTADSPDAVMDIIRTHLPERDHAAIDEEDQEPRKGKDALGEPWRDWMHACMLKKAFRAAVREFEGKEADKEAKRVQKEARASAKASQSSQSQGTKSASTTPTKKSKTKPAGRGSDTDDSVQSRLQYVVGKKTSKPKSTSSTPSSSTLDVESQPPRRSSKPSCFAPLIEEDDVFSSPAKAKTKRPTSKAVPEASQAVPSQSTAMSQKSSVNLVIDLDSSPEKPVRATTSKPLTPSRRKKADVTSEEDAEATRPTLKKQRSSAAIVAALKARLKPPPIEIARCSCTCCFR